MRVLFDTHVILDVLLDREPFVTDSSALLSHAERGEISGFAAATTVTTIYYLCAKQDGRTQAKKHITTLLSLLEVAPINRGVLVAALASKVPDFEDTVLAESGRTAAVDAITSRNKKDFAHAKLPVYTPAELRRLLSSGEEAGAT